MYEVNYQRPDIETSKGAKRPGGKWSRWRTVQGRTVQVANRLTWQRNVKVVNWQS